VVWFGKVLGLRKLFREACVGGKSSYKLDLVVCLQKANQYCALIEC